MEISKKISQQIMLGTGLLLIIPMFIFPRQMGTELAKIASINALYELVFYGVVLFFYNRRTTLYQLLQGSVVCLVYRLGVGAIFGLLISWSYSMKLSVSLQLGMASYLPAIFFHVLTAPVVLRPMLLPLLGELRSRRRTPGFPEATNNQSGSTTLAVSRKQGVVLSSAAPSQAEPAREPISRQAKFAPTVSKPAPLVAPGNSDTGFERAVRYIGEHGSVYLAAVVDPEGLLLARFSRGQFEAEDLAPMAQMMCESSQQVLSRQGFSLSKLERLDLALSNERIMIVQGGSFSLLVIAESQCDDLVNIRVNQGTEMIAKYMEERFGPSETSSVENKDVSST